MTQRERELLRERVSASLPPPDEDNMLFQKSRQETVVSGSQEGMESHGRINSGPHSSSLSPAGSSRRFGSVIKGSTHVPSAKLWNQVSMHRTLRPLLGPPRARSLRSTSLPYHGYIGGPAGPACKASPGQFAALGKI